MAGWNGAPFTYVRNCFTVRTALVSAAGAATQPIFQPVTLNDLPALPTMTVRSRMPGRVAIGTCRRPSKTRCSYTSSAMTTRSFRSATSAITESSSDVNTLPVGLCGVLSRIALVLLVIAALSSSGSKRHPLPSPLSSRRSVTGRRSRAGERYRGGVRIVVRLEDDHFVTHLGECQNGRRDRLGSAGGDEDLAIGVVVELVATSMVVADRLAQLGDAWAGWVLVVPFADRGDRVGQDLVRPVGVREALAEVDAAGGHGQSGHLCEDRGPKAPHAADERIVP